MSFKRLSSVNILDRSHRFNVSPTMLSELFITFDGTNQAAMTFALGDLGTLITKVNGNEKDNVELPRLAELNNIIEGANQASSVAGAAFRFTVKVPMYNYAGSRPDYGNGFMIRPKDTFEVEHQFPNAIASLVASGNVTYWGVMADMVTPSVYESKLKQYNLTIGGAGTSTHNLELENVAFLAVQNDTNLTSLQIKVDDDVKYESIDRDELYAYTQQRNNIKTFSATQTPIIVPFTNSQRVEATQNRRIQVTVQAGGAFTLNMIAGQVFATPARLAESSSMIQARLQSAGNAKAAQGITAAAEFLKS